MAQIDTSQVVLLDTRIGVEGGMNLTMNVMWDDRSGMHRIMVLDTITQNDASRVVTEGRDANNMVPVKSFVDALPNMIEEIIVLNKLMGPRV
jgi:hypothetical protein